MDHITSLEQSLCTDFFCCGAQLPDFHALLDHFERVHVVVLAPNGKRVYPREGLRAVPLHPSLSSSTTTSPSDSPVVSRKSSFTVPPVYTPFTPSLPVDPADPLFDDDVLHSDFPFAFPHSEEEEDPSSDHEILSPTVFHLPTKLVHRHHKLSVKKRHSASSLSSSSASSKRREKMYRCPKSPCLKAYLNPNGLKYHLEKGTCKFPQNDISPASSSSSSPVIQQQQPLSLITHGLDGSAPLWESPSSTTCTSPSLLSPPPLTPPPLLPTSSQPTNIVSAPQFLPPASFHYPIPTYPNGYSYPHQLRPYFA